MSYDFEWRRLSVKEVLTCFDTDDFSGLTNRSVSRRMSKFGKNHIWDKKNNIFVQTVLKHIFDFSVIFLITALLVAYFNGFSLIIGISCLIVLLSLITLISFEILYKAVRARHDIAFIPTARVFRNGSYKMECVTSLVPGDVVILRPGDIVGADVRVIESDGLVVSNKELTGRSDSIMLVCDAILPRDFENGKDNMAFASSVVLKGYGKGVCVACGGRTYAAHIGKSLVSECKRENDAVLRAERRSSVVSVFALAFSFLCVLLGYIFGLTDALFADSVLNALAFTASVSAGVYLSAVYADRYVINKNSLSSGISFSSQNPLRCNKDVNRIVIGDVSVLKSGETSVTGIYAKGKYRSENLGFGEDAVRYILMTLGISSFSTALTDNSFSKKDDTVVDACSEYLKHSKTTEACVLEGHISASDENFFNTALCRHNGELWTLCSGSIKDILTISTALECDGYDEILTEKRISEISSVAAKLEARGKRVIAVSKKIAPVQDLSRVALMQHSMTFVGFVVIESPLSESAVGFLKDAVSRGLGLCVITNDPTDASLIENLCFLDLCRCDFRSRDDVIGFKMKSDVDYLISLEGGVSASEVGYRLVRALEKRSEAFAYFTSRASDVVVSGISPSVVSVGRVSSFDTLPDVLRRASSVSLRSVEAFSVFFDILQSFEHKRSPRLWQTFVLTASFACRLLLFFVSFFLKNPLFPLIFVFWGLIFDQILVFIFVFIRKK